MVQLALGAIAANLVVMVAAFGLGRWIEPLLPNSFSRFTQTVCTWAAGFGVLGIAVFLAGVMALNRWTIGGVLAVGVAAAIAGKSKFLQVRVPVAMLPAAIVTAVLVWTAMAGLAEPIGDWGKDGVAYHLVGPKVWLREGIIRPIPDNSVTSYPATGEMVFTALRAFGGERAPGFSAWWTLALLLGIGASLARRCGLNAGEAWWAAALIATMPAVYNGSHSGFVDVIYATFVLAAVRVGFEATERKHYVAFGIFCGLALATKYPAAIAIPLLIFCAMWKRREGTGVRAAITNGLLVAGVAFAVGSPFYIRNWIELGFPIYPSPWWVTRFTEVKYFSGEALRAFYDYNRGRTQARGGIAGFLALPYSLTFHTANFNGAGGIGLAPLALGPLGIVAAWRNAYARRLALLALLLVTAWFVTMRESRYLIHCYVLGAVFAVFGWRLAVQLTGIRGKLWCAAVVALSVAYGGYMIGTQEYWGVRALFSPSLAKNIHMSEVVFAKSFDYVNQNPEVKRVLILDRSVPAYYSDKDYVKPFGQWGELVYPDIKTTADVLPRLRELGVTHVMDVESTIAPYQVPAGYPGLKLVFEVPGQRVYRVVER